MMNIKKIMTALGILAWSSWSFGVSALPEEAQEQTHRIPQFSNEQVVVWKTIIYPSSKKRLSMHRHKNNRVLVALTEGTLKVTNDKGKTHYLHLKKDHAYFLEKDLPSEMHTDENISDHPVHVIIIELKDLNNTRKPRYFSGYA